jgi:beta-glucanase (GH16 family)
VVVAAIVALTVLLMVIASGVLEPRPHGLTGTWTLAFSDSFDGRSLDGGKWEANRHGRDDGGDAPFDVDADDAWFTDNNVSVRDGKLVITLKREPKTIDGKIYPFSSGVVQTAQHYLVRPQAYIEARIKVPKCNGCWPAFWTTAPDEPTSQLDILEFPGTDLQTRPTFNYHAPGIGPLGPTVYGEPSKDYTDGYHLYGLLWDGYKAVPRLDGEAYRGVTRDMTQLPQALILNLSVQSGSKPPAGTRMLVDWVRVWRPGTS